MKLRKSVVLMLLAAGLVLVAGLAVAYYNTASLGYDNANFLSYSSEGIRIFDITIFFADIKEITERLLNFFRTELIVISIYLV